MSVDEKRNIFAEALVGESRHPSICEEDDIYGPLLGSWVVETRDVLEDSSELCGEGEWHFARVLEGRAIQDVWIAPSRFERPVFLDHPRNRYGTSIRTFDSASRNWQIIWLNPVSGAFDVLHSRVEDGKIVQVGSGSTGHFINWTFESITSNDFHWVGRLKGEDGQWRVGAEFFGRRSS